MNFVDAVTVFAVILNTLLAILLFQFLMQIIDERRVQIRRPPEWS